MTASWCDKLSSTPSIGIGFDPSYLSSASMLDRIAPLLNKLGNTKEMGFSIEKVDPFGLQLLHDEGYEYGIDPRRMFVEFKHRMKVRPVSGAYPELEMMSKPEPYTKGLQTIAKKLSAIYEMLDPKSARLLTRVGIVSTTVVDTQAIPPGIEKFISHVQLPWDGKAEALNFRVTGTIEKSDSWTDKCIHHISEIENEEGMMSLRFDYQRTFQAGRSINSAKLNQLLSEISTVALNYFESLAEGNRFDIKYD